MKDPRERLLKLSLAFAFLPYIFAVPTLAQKVGLSTKEAVIEQLGKQKKADLSSAKICVERLKESSKIIIIGSFRYDYGCHFDGAFVNSIYFENSADLSTKALGSLGWKDANRKQREELAKLWVEKGLLAFSTVLYTKDKDFNEGEFHAPTVASNEDGEVIVTLWTSVMRRKKGFNYLKFQFTKDGNLL